MTGWANRQRERWIKGVLVVAGLGLLGPVACEDAYELAGGDCGNGTLEVGEQCDGTDLGGRTCTGLGYTGGWLQCAADCTFDPVLCDRPLGCGDQVLDPGEACDGDNLGGITCESLGLGGGLLQCSPACQLIISSCEALLLCGNGELDSGEHCDDSNRVSCDGCSDRCQVERCGNNVVDCGETCDDGNTQPGDGCDSECQLE